MCGAREKGILKDLSWQTRKLRLRKPSNCAELISEGQSQQLTKSSQPERVGASLHEERNKWKGLVRKSLWSRIALLEDAL